MPIQAWQKSGLRMERPSGEHPFAELQSLAREIGNDEEKFCSRNIPRFVGTAFMTECTKIWKVKGQRISFPTASMSGLRWSSVTHDQNTLPSVPHL